MEARERTTSLGGTRSGFSPETSGRYLAIEFSSDKTKNMESFEVDSRVSCRYFTLRRDRSARADESFTWALFRGLVRTTVINKRFWFEVYL